MKRRKQKGRKRVIIGMVFICGQLLSLFAELIIQLSMLNYIDIPLNNLLSHIILIAIGIIIYTWGKSASIK